MTVFVFLIITSLIGYNLSNFSNETANRAARLKVGLIIMGLSVLPLTFGPIVPISHFIFEATNSSFLYGFFIIITLLIGLSVVRIRRHWNKFSEPVLVWTNCSVLLCYGIWFLSALWLSGYEGGATTPSVFDSPIYILDWLTAIVLALFIIIIASKSIHQFSLFFKFTADAFLTIISLLIYSTI